MSDLRDRQREETRRRVYEAALVYIRRDGAVDSRIDDIARAAGVSRGTFYFHYPSKDHVLVELAMEREEHVAAAVEALPEDAPLRAVLDAVAVAMARQWEGDPRIFPEAAAAVLRLSGLVSDAEGMRVRTSLAGRFRAAAARGELSDRLPPELLSDFFLVNTMGGMLGWCAWPQAPLGTILSTVIDLFLQGAAGAPEQKQRRPKPGRQPGRQKEQARPRATKPAAKRPGRPRAKPQPRR